VFETLKQIELWQGTKRLLKFILNLYTRPQTYEERLRSMGVKLGNEVQLQPFTLDERYARLLTIEDQVTIGKGTTIYLSDGAINTTLEEPNPAPVQFGAVRICKRAVVTRDVIIMSGVTVGEGAIVGAGSLLTRDVPPFSVVAGVPAKVLATVEEMKQRDNERARTGTTSPDQFHIHMPNWRRRRRIGMTPEEQDLYYNENFPKYGL
jgi:carbonic anhydrase/acetyltransferase-like protein (isoleucine patch superfamily)